MESIGTTTVAILSVPFLLIAGVAINMLLFAILGWIKSKLSD